MHFESHDMLIDGLHLHPEENGCVKRLLTDSQTLAFVREWAEQVANVELEFGDVSRLGSKLNDLFLSLDLRQFRAAFFAQTVAPCRVELSDDEGDDDRSLHVLDDQARGARVRENKGAIARPLGTGGGQGKGTRPWSTRDSGFTGLLQALSERGSTVGAANAACVANLKQTWDDLEPEEAFDLVPRCKPAKVYDPALSRLELVISKAQHREHTRGALGQTGANRLLGPAPSGALERALSAAIEQN